MLAIFTRGARGGFFPVSTQRFRSANVPRATAVIGNVEAGPSQPPAPPGACGMPATS